MSGERPDVNMGSELPVDSRLSGTPDPLSMDYTLDSVPLNLTLSAEDQAKVTASIEAIFQSGAESPSEEDQEMADADEGEPKVDLEDQQLRTENLKGILPTLAQLWWSRSEHMDQAVEKLADGCRTREFKSFHIIDLYVGAITAALPSTLQHAFQFRLFSQYIYLKNWY